MGSLDMSQNQNGISSGFSVDCFSIELGPRQSSNPVSGSRKSQASSLWAKTAQILTCSIMEKPHTWLDDCLNMLLSCFRKGMSDWRSGVLSYAECKQPQKRPRISSALQIPFSSLTPIVFSLKSIAVMRDDTYGDRDCRRHFYDFAPAAQFRKLEEFQNNLFSLCYPR